MCLLLSVNGKTQAVWPLWSGSLREQRKAEGDLATIKHPEKNTSLPLGLQKRRLKNPGSSWHCPSKTPVPYSKIMHPSCLPIPLPGKNPGRNSWRVEDETSQASWQGPIQACSRKAQVRILSVHCSGFLREDSELSGHRSPGPKAS